MIVVSTIASLRQLPRSEACRSTMPEYKFYIISLDGHRIQPPTVAMCETDIDAIKAARQLLDGHDIEIWEGTRIVAYLVPESFAPDKAKPASRTARRASE